MQELSEALAGLEDGWRVECALPKLEERGTTSALGGAPAMGTNPRTADDVLEAERAAEAERVARADGCVDIFLSISI